MSSSSPATEPRRILFLIRALSVGGAERQLAFLARGLARRGHDVAVATFYAGGALERDLTDSGVRLIDLAKRGRWDLPSFLRRLCTTIRTEQPDILYTFLSGANVLGALMRPALGPAQLIWSVRASDMDLSRYDWMTRAFWRLERGLSGVPNRIVANSVAGRNHAVAAGFPAQKIIVVPNGIDTDRFIPDSARGRAFRATWGIAPDARVVGIVARLDPMKGHDILIDAFARLVADRADLRLVCVGDGPAAYRQALMERAARLSLANRVVWTGETDSMVGAFNAVDVLCSSSRYGEGFSNTVGEAMACGTPCVVTDVGDSGRLVGNTGLVVPREDAGALAEALGQALDGGVDGAAARRRIASTFSLDALTTATERAFT